MRPLVDELKEFWGIGVRLNTAESPRYKLLFKLALMCVACDIPAARKCCGFKGHSANYGCSRCKKFFPGGFREKKDYSGFDRSQWQPRTYEAHIEVVKQILKCNTQNAIESLETETGVKHSILTELPYFNPIRFTVIDPMHNFFLGTAKTVMKKIWLERGTISSTQLDTIQTRVDSLQVPSGIGRIPTKIASNFSGFTAEQLKNWVILYSMYALRGIISQDEYHCWQSFVLACFFLCRRTVSRVDVLKADTLLVKFCRHMERLYGKDSVTPNMHLHCHMAACIKDYGSVYGFWCFSYERYNGILGSFPTNKKKVASQLMRRFISETNSCSLTIPNEFSHAFENLLSTIVLHEPSEIHRHISSCEVSTCFDLTCISLPKTYKTSILSTSDFENLKVVYKNLYDNDENHVYTRSIKILKTLRIYGQQFGSIRDPRTKNNSFILAAWASDDGSISSVGAVRPGKVLHYILNKVLIGTEHREHLFAVVGWFKEHRCRMLYGKPLEVWKYAQYLDDGPATFLPIHKILCRFCAGYGHVASPFGGDEQVMFVCPLPTFTYF